MPNSHLVLQEARRISSLNRQVNRILKSIDSSLVEEDESSIEKHRVEKATQHFRGVVQQHYKVAFEQYSSDSSPDTQTMVNQIFLDIKRFVLQALYRHTQPDEVGNTIRTFIEEHLEQLVAGESAALVASRSLLNSNTDIYHIAWRNFDPGANCFGWANLLSEPTDADYDTQAYSMVETGREDATLYSAREELRLRLAYYFLAVTDESQGMAEEHQVWHANFIGQLADMRRAHNGVDVEEDNTLDIDAPTCFPGGLTRVARMGMGHPIAALPLDPHEMLMPIMRARIVSRFKRSLDTLKTDEEKSQLYYSLVMMSEYNIDAILEGRMEYLDSLLKVRKQFRKQLGDNRKVYHYVEQELIALGCRTFTKNEQVHIRSYLANLGGGYIAKVLYNLYLNALASPMHEETVESEHALYFPVTTLDILKKRFQSLRFPERICQTRAQKLFKRELIQFILKEYLLTLFQSIEYFRSIVVPILDNFAKNIALELTVEDSEEQIQSTINQILTTQEGELGEVINTLSSMEIVVLKSRIFSVLNMTELDKMKQAQMLSAYARCQFNATTENVTDAKWTLNMPMCLHPSFQDVPACPLIVASQATPSVLPKVSLVVGLLPSIMLDLPWDIKAELVVYDIASEKMNVSFVIQTIPDASREFYFCPTPWYTSNLSAEEQQQDITSDLVFATSDINAAFECSVTSVKSQKGLIQGFPMGGLGDGTDSHAFYSLCIDVTRKTAQLTLHWVLQPEVQEKITGLLLSHSTINLTQFISSIKKLPTPFLQSTNAISVLESLVLSGEVFLSGEAPNAYPLFIEEPANASPSMLTSFPRVSPDRIHAKAATSLHRDRQRPRL